MFFTSADGQMIYPIADIDSIVPNRSFGGGHSDFMGVATMRNGPKVAIANCSIDDISNPIISVVAAPPGYTVIHAALNNQGSGYVARSSPVIGFAVSSDGETRPLTARGIDDGMFRRMPVQHPNGFVWDEANDCGYDELRQYLKEWAVAEQARRAIDAERSAREVVQ